jgi:hypothetical protein
MEITYTLVGDYYLPDLVLSDPPDAPPLERYGELRKRYLREYRPIMYSRLLLSEQLFPHLRKVDEAANKRFDAIMSDILAYDPPPDKAADNLAWATHMAEAHRMAEKMTLDEIVYV